MPAVIPASDTAVSSVEPCWVVGRRGRIAPLLPPLYVSSKMQDSLCAYSRGQLAGILTSRWMLNSRQLAFPLKGLFDLACSRNRFSYSNTGSCSRQWQPVSIAGWSAEKSAN